MGNMYIFCPFVPSWNDPSSADAFDVACSALPFTELPALFARASHIFCHFLSRS
jgi:hypothetical protein